MKVTFIVAAFAALTQALPTENSIVINKTAEASKLLARAPLHLQLPHDDDLVKLIHALVSFATANKETILANKTSEIASSLTNRYHDEDLVNIFHSLASLATVEKDNASASKIAETVTTETPAINKTSAASAFRVSWASMVNEVQSCPGRDCGDELMRAAAEAKATATGEFITSKTTSEAKATLSAIAPRFPRPPFLQHYPRMYLLDLTPIQDYSALDNNSTSAMNQTEREHLVRRRERYIEQQRRDDEIREALHEYAFKKLKRNLQFTVLKDAEQEKACR